MKKRWLILLCLTSALMASSFREEFLDEVMTMASLNPTEVMSDEQVFIRKFYETSKQEAAESDALVRPVYVTAQGDFERTMAYMLEKGKIDCLLGWIHTPTPATPLCIRGNVTQGLVDEEIAKDPKRLFTVMKRPEIIRDFLQKGGVLVALYPREGLFKRTEEQREVFEQVKKDYPNHLIDCPLSVSELPQDMIGATYIFKTCEDEWFAFAIQATQANAPADDRKWVMWFGHADNPEIHERINQVIELSSGAHLPELRSR